MLKHPENLFRRYINGSITDLITHDTSHGDGDKRFVYVISTDCGEQLALKVTNNSFTSSMRIQGWARLAELYNSCGIYAPRIITDKDGSTQSLYSEDNVEYIVYAEELKKYKTAAEWGLNDDADYFEDMIKAEAEVARRSKEHPGWYSAWCIYERFCDEDETDETYYWQEEFYKLVLNEAPELSDRATRIWQRFLALYEELRPQYKALPEAFFQADEGRQNTMLDENMRFVGVLDFNISGMEKVLNYFFRRFCGTSFTNEELDRLTDPACLRSKDDFMYSRLAVIKRYYEFSPYEKTVFPLYYRTVYPVECDNSQHFQAVVRSGDRLKLTMVLDWIEYQQTRQDIIL